jgi:ribose-phosphate pyrophosphokinase
MLVCGGASPELADGIADRMGLALSQAVVERFPDGEVHVALGEDPRGRHVVLIQSTSPPPDQHLMALLALSDAARRAGAAKVTAVVPYFGYARQDHRAGFEAVTARLVADLMAAAGIGALISVDVHTQAIEGFFTLPVRRLSAVPLLAEAIADDLPDDSVIVAPDLGAAKLADAYASRLGLPVAIVHKLRSGPEAVTAVRVTGEVHRRTPIIVDDMISTGGTIVAAIHAVEALGARTGAIVAASHGLFAGSCDEQLSGLGLRRIIVTDSVRQAPHADLPLSTLSLTGLIAGALTDGPAGG